MSAQYSIGWNDAYQRKCRYLLNTATNQWDFYDWNVEAQDVNDSSYQSTTDSNIRQDSPQSSHATAGATESFTYSIQPSAPVTYQTQSWAATSSASGHGSGYSQQPSRPRRSGNNNRSLPRGQGAWVQGDYVPGQNSHYELIDSSFYVRSRRFFAVGRVFAVMWNETASTTTAPVDYTTSTVINRVRFQDNFVYTNVRRFVVVRDKKEFCFACPIFTYSGKATMKPGVRPEEHSIVYTSGYNPQLLVGESGITKPSIGVDQEPGTQALSTASRIYFGIHHPIQYNVRVKDIGMVPKYQQPTLIGNWREEDEKESGQAQDVTANAERSDLEPVYENQVPGSGNANQYYYTSQ